MKHLHVTPAYGRDYKTKTEAVDAWRSGKDFIVQGLSGYAGSYVGKGESSTLKQDGYSGVMIRFGDMRKLVIVNL